MPLDALPEHLQDIEKNFPDDEQFGTTSFFGRLYRWYQKKTKTWFAFSYRCRAKWARWRRIPKVLLAVGGTGLWRYENEDSTIVSETGLDTGEYRYLSRIQYYKRWHFAIQWPLMISCHRYDRAEAVPKFGEPLPDLDDKLWFFYWNHFDADFIYWMVTSIFLGRSWK